MSWKSECILVNEDKPGYFGTFPSHRPDRAIGLLEKLFPGSRIRSAGRSYLADELIPAKGLIAFGAYDSGCILSDWYHLIDCTRDINNPILLRIIDLFPKASILALELCGVTNMFGYALFETGELRRAYGGNAQNGITMDIGNRLPEEKEVYHNSQAEVGESSVFHIAARFFGVSLDQFATDMLEMERFVCPKE